MAQPITWQNVLGPSLADASRPFDAASRTFDSMFSGLGNLLKDAETRQETGRDLIKDKNRDVILDMYAKAKTPEQVAAVQQQEAALRASMGNMLRSGDVRGVDDKRLMDTRTMQRQGMEFDNYIKDERSKPYMEAYKAASLKGDKVGMANAEASYTQVGGPRLSEMMAYGDSRNWQLEERGEKRAGWGREREMHVDTLFDRKHQRSIEDGQLGVSRGQLGVAQANSRISQQNANTALAGFNLNVIRNLVDDRRKEEEIGADLIGKLGKTSQYSTTSAEGAAQLAAARDKLPEADREIGTILIEKINSGKLNIPLGDALAAMGGVRSTYLRGDGGDASVAYENLIKSAAKGNPQNKAADFQADQYLGKMEQNKANVAKLASLYAGINKGKPMDLSILDEPADRPRGAATPQGTANKRATDGEVDNEFDAPAPVVRASVPAAPVVTPLQALESAEAAWKKSGSRVGPEMTAMREARTAYQQDQAATVARQEVLMKRVGRADEKQENTLQRVKMIENRFKVNQKTAQEFAAKGRPIPMNVARLLEQDGADLEVLRERLGNR